MDQLSFEIFHTEYQTQLQVLPHWRLKQLSKELTQAQNQRFPRTGQAKVELVERGFTEDEFNRLMAVVDDPEDRVIFLVMACFAMRENEAARLKGRDIRGDQVLIPDSKGGFAGTYQIPPSLLSLIPACGDDERIFLRDYEDPLKELGLRFRKYRERAGLTEIYGFAKAGGRSGSFERPLSRISLHSFRHFGIQRFFRLCGSVELTRRFARHKKIETTLKYLRRTMKAEVDQIMLRMPLADRELPAEAVPVLAFVPQVDLLP